MKVRVFIIFSSLQISILRWCLSYGTLSSWLLLMEKMLFCESQVLKVYVCHSYIAVTQAPGFWRCRDSTTGFSAAGSGELPTVNERCRWKPPGPVANSKPLVSLRHRGKEKEGEADEGGTGETGEKGRGERWDAENNVVLILHYLPERIWGSLAKF